MFYFDQPVNKKIIFVYIKNKRNSGNFWTPRASFKKKNGKKLFKKPKFATF